METSIQQVHPEDPSQVDLGRGPGRRLRQARQARGVSVEQIAAELHLAPPIIEAIEQERQEGLPAQVFIVGYIRNYARVLGLDPEPLIQAYRAAHPDAGSTELRPRRTGREVGSGHLVIRLVTLAIVVGLAALFGLWWYSNQAELSLNEYFDFADRQETPPSDTAPMEFGLGPEGQDPSEIAASPTLADRLLAPPPEPPEPPEPASLVAAQESPEPTAGPAPVEATNVPVRDAPTPPTASSDVEAADEPAAGETDRRGVIELTFDGPCWVDIRDATRDYKLFGEMAKGDRRILEGTPPYSVIIGNAAAVTITIDGEPYDLESHARGNVARFTLDPRAVL